MYRSVAVALAVLAWPMDGVGHAPLFVLWGAVALIVGAMELRTLPSAD